jgi:Ser/Thr protein kinase RdoA (MazF antagonist)
MADDFTLSARAAAVEVARSFGLPADAPEVLHEKSNVLVRLGSVVARVPGTTRLHRLDPAVWLARDVSVSRHVAARGVRVVSPLEGGLAGPHHARGLPVTLWHFTPHDPGYRFAPAEVARGLSDLHSALRDYPGELPVNGPLDEIRRILDALVDPDPRLRPEAERLAGTLPDGPVQALHGDAHAGNVIATAEGLCWLDFEDTWRGPLGWDLATLAGHDGAAALADYPGAPDPAELSPFGDLREFFGVCWGFVIAQRFPERTAETEERLRTYFG